MARVACAPRCMCWRRRRSRRSIAVVAVVAVAFGAAAVATAALCLRVRACKSIVAAVALLMPAERRACCSRLGLPRIRGELVNHGCEAVLDIAVHHEGNSAGPLLRVWVEQLLDEGAKLLRVHVTHGFVAAVANLLHKHQQVAALEGLGELAHFVQDTAEGPDVGLCVVGNVLADLWAHVIWASDAGALDVTRVLELCGNAKVAHLDEVVLCEKDVCCLEIPVQDALGMDVSQGKHNLAKPLHDLLL